MSMMIALVGEQLLPNFLPVRYHRPESVLLVYTARTQPKYASLQATLQKEVRVFGIETDAYNMPAIVQSLNAELDKRTGQGASPPTFNVTGGTKAMSLAAYQVAQQRRAPMIYLESEGKNTRIYHYTWVGQQPQAAGSELVPECIKLRDVFDLHFGPGNWQEHGASHSEGGRFEELLARVLRAQNFEVMLGVKALNQVIDIDVAVRSGNQYGIIEAKMGTGGRKLGGVKQLSTAVRLLGTYSRTFCAITVSPDPSHHMLTDAANIDIISLLSYDKTTNTLSSADEAELLSRVAKALKG